jgi:AcrR family transcriptional regulator
MNENQRVRLSRQMLRESLIKLLYEKSIHKISVREICDGAQINRTTFYKYYGSQYELLEDMENEVLGRIESYLSADGGGAGNGLQSLNKILAFANDNRGLCRILFNNNVDADFPEKLFNLPSIRNLLAASLRGAYTDVEYRYVYNFVVNGGFSVIKTWLNKDAREPPETMAALLSGTINRLFPA